LHTYHSNLIVDVFIVAGSQLFSRQDNYSNSSPATGSGTTTRWWSLVSSGWFLARFSVLETTLSIRRRTGGVDDKASDIPESPLYHITSCTPICKELLAKGVVFET